MSMLGSYSKKMAMIGTGSQSEFQALGMRAVLGIEDLSVYDVDPHAMKKLRLWILEIL